MITAQLMYITLAIIIECALFKLLWPACHSSLLYKVLYNPPPSNLLLQLCLYLIDIISVVVNACCMGVFAA